MPRRTTSDDRARTLALLWRDAAVPRRGPERRSDVEAIVDAAIRLADVKGLAAVTMRRIAQELGVSAMSLYTYLPSKAALVDLMLDQVYRQMQLREPDDRTWPERLTAIADDNRALHLAHPWIGAVSAARPPLGPGVISKYEHELAALDGLGLSDVEMDDALTLLLSFVRAGVRMAADAQEVQHADDMTDEQWWTANAPLLGAVFDPTAYPLASRVGSAAGAAHGSAYDPEHAYRFGLGRLLDGLAMLIEERGGK